MISQKYDGFVSQEVALLEQGRIEEAIIVDEEGVDPTYDQLSEEMTRLIDFYHNKKQQSRHIADIGTTSALIVAAFVIGILSYIFSTTIVVRVIVQISSTNYLISIRFNLLHM